MIPGIRPVFSGHILDIEKDGGKKVSFSGHTLEIKLAMFRTSGSAIVASKIGKKIIWFCSAHASLFGNTSLFFYSFSEYVNFIQKTVIV